LTRDEGRHKDCPYKSQWPSLLAYHWAKTTPHHRYDPSHPSYSPESGYTIGLE